MPDCLVGLGSNLGDRSQTLARAVALLAAQPGVTGVRSSAHYRTTPIGGPAGQDEFLNAAVRLETSLSPEQLYALLRRIETDLGRERVERWAARQLDLDLLLYGDLVVQSPTLVIPHPRMALRRFVLEPAAEIAGQMVHPTIGWTVEQLLEHLNQALNYIAIVGLPASGKTQLAEALAARFSGRILHDPARDVPIVVSADPPSQVLSREIEFLCQRADLLSAANWRDDRRLAVSDFWLDQSLAYASAWLGADQYAAVERAWRAAQTLVVGPKLLVLLDVPVEQSLASAANRGQEGLPVGPEGALHDRSALERLRAALVALANRPRQGPVLHLQVADWQQALVESTAAVEAMK